MKRWITSGTWYFDYRIILFTQSIKKEKEERRRTYVAVVVVGVARKFFSNSSTSARDACSAHTLFVKCTSVSCKSFSVAAAQNAIWKLSFSPSARKQKKGKREGTKNARS